MRHIRRPSGFDLMLLEWPFFKDPLHQKLPLSFPYHVIPLSLLHSSHCPCNNFFNHSIISENTPANKQVTSKPSKKWLKARNATDRKALSIEPLSSILDCYFSTSHSFPQSFTCCRLHPLHILSQRRDTSFFKFALFWVDLKKTSATFICTENPKGTVDQITLDMAHSQSEFRHNVMTYRVIFADFQGEVLVLKHFLLNPSVTCRDNYKKAIHRLISEKSEHRECWVKECCGFFLHIHMMLLIM